ncbi:MAG: nitroreductase family protein [Bacteroidota bacterium]|nr:nitroreductase family protein [Bacteroidota bacterium]
MEFSKLVERRQSDRAYYKKPVEENKIIQCIEAVRLAPSACNSQPWTFIVVDDEELKNKIADSMSNRVLPLNHFTKQAPVHVVVVNEGSNLTASLGNKVKDKDYSKIDVGIAAEHFCLQAADLGLGTCMIGWFNEQKIKNLLHVPAKKRIELVITIGYSDDELRAKKRKSIERITARNSYGNKISYLNELYKKIKI